MRRNREITMKAVIVYESHWGNTAAVAEAIAAGFGPEAQALNTDQATGPAIADADLIVAGAPLMAFGLPGPRTQAGLEKAASSSPDHADLSHPSMRTWLERLPDGHGGAAAFETKIRWSPGGATDAIEQRLEKAGYRTVAKAQKFVVTGQSGPLREGELEKARQWGTDLAAAIRSSTPLAIT
jgi:flavorubredoxin